MGGGADELLGILEGRAAVDILGPPTFGMLRLLAHWAVPGGGVKVKEDELLAEVRLVGGDEWEQAVADGEPDLPVPSPGRGQKEKAEVFFVEAHYHHSPKRAGEQVRYIAQREEGLRDGERRELYGIGPRYRAFRGDETAIRRALVEDAQGLRNPVYFRFILTVDNPTAERFARLNGHLAERVLRDSVQKTFPGAARGVQGVFAVHQHGGGDRPAHPHVHALLSPRLEDRSPTHLSPRTIERVRERGETEVLRALERQEQRLEHARKERTPLEALTPYRVPDHGPQLDLRPARTRRRPLGPIGLFFLRTRKGRRLAAWAGAGWTGWSGRATT